MLPSLGASGRLFCENAKLGVKIPPQNLLIGERDIQSKHCIFKVRCFRTLKTAYSTPASASCTERQIMRNGGLQPTAPRRIGGTPQTRPATKVGRPVIGMAGACEHRSAVNPPATERRGEITFIDDKALVSLCFSCILMLSVWITHTERRVEKHCSLPRL